MAGQIKFGMASSGIGDSILRRMEYFIKYSGYSERGRFWTLFDMGLLAQTLMLAAKDKGISTVPQAFATNYASAIKKFLSIPETKRLVLGMSIGYADMESPANQYKTYRAETDEFVSWIE